MQTLDNFLSASNVDVLAYQKYNTDIIYILFVSQDESSSNNLVEYSISKDKFYYFGGEYKDDKLLRNTIMCNKVYMECNLRFINQIKL